MKKKMNFLLILTTILLINFTAFAQNDGIYFSTEEDFLATNTAGAVIIVSDGDLLRWDGTVFMKNADLLSRFDEPFDLGLDAVDVLSSSNERLAMFSTELDSVNGVFDAGDLLITTGVVIQNEALLYKFNLPYKLNLGLDAVQVIGKYEKIRYFINLIGGLPIDHFQNNPNELADYLKKFEIDIRFSTEGTAPDPKHQRFLDGDLLSARDGVIVIPNSALLNVAVPAGLPNRGVDYGLDGVMSPRNGLLSRTYFSTELLNTRPDFNDGDLLQRGVATIIIPHFQFIQNFNPKSRFLGIDALSFWQK